MHMGRIGSHRPQVCIYTLCKAQLFNVRTYTVLTQRLECFPYKKEVTGSNPVDGTAAPHLGCISGCSEEQLFASIAQWTEHLASNQSGGSSNLSGGSLQRVGNLEVSRARLLHILRSFNGRTGGC